eukprot:COSAG05_NODE_401_length_10253_cov_23.087453_7_plen_132_part_00
MGNPFRQHGELLATSTAYRYALVVLVPALFVIFIAVGFSDYIIEDQVSELWVPKDSDYATASAHKDTHGEGATSTQFLVTGRPRDGACATATAHCLLLACPLWQRQSLTLTCARWPCVLPWPLRHLHRLHR